MTKAEGVICWSHAKPQKTKNLQLNTGLWFQLVFCLLICLMLHLYQLIKLFRCQTFRWLVTIFPERQLCIYHGAFKRAKVYCVHVKSPFKKYIFVVFMTWNVEILKVVTYLLTLSEMAETMEVHFLVDG